MPPQATPNLLKTELMAGSDDGRITALGTDLSRNRTTALAMQPTGPGPLYR